MVETRWCAAAWSQIAIDYMKFCLNPLWLVYVPAPSPPPLRQPRPFFLIPFAYHYPVSTLTRGIQGCPKTISLDKIFGIHLFWKSFQTSFFLPLCVRTFLQHLLPKMLSFFRHSIPENLFRIFLSSQLFHPCLTNANYLCRRIFGTSLFNPSRRASGFTREGGRGENR